MTNPESSVFDMSTDHEIASDTVITEVSPFGYGSGKISLENQRQTGEVTSEDESTAEEFIHSPAALVPVDVEAKNESGCGDGRPTGEVFRLDENGNREKFKRSLNRSKVFGGGAVMVAAALLASGRSNAKNGKELVNEAINLHNEHGFACGGHTDEHATGDSCGCGAIDKLPEILTNVTRYKEQIRQTLQDLLGSDFDGNLFNGALENIENSVDSLDFATYKGKETEIQILQSGAVLKQLKGGHQEDFVILNFVTDKTFNQSGLFEYTEDKIQAFCVDMWELPRYAEMAGGDDAHTHALAYYGELIYTLATSATLTDGSQRVFVYQAA